MYTDWSAATADLWAPTCGYLCHSGCRLDLLFYDWSAGEVTFWVKSTVQYSDELNHKIAQYKGDIIYSVSLL